MKFDAFGNLIGDIIQVTLQEIEGPLVNSIEGSSTRRRNYQRLCEFVNALDRNIITRIWIDGSFCTSKKDPNDIDVIMFFPPSEENKEYCSRLDHEKESYRLSHHIDFYFAVDLRFVPFELENLDLIMGAMNQISYWKDFFGHDRNERPKAILELSFAEVMQHE